MKDTFQIIAGICVLLTIACLLACAAALWFGDFWIGFCRFCAALVTLAIALWMHITAESYK